MAGQRPGRHAELVGRRRGKYGVLDSVTIGMTAEKTVIVSSAMTVGHFVAEMPQVYATPTMILPMSLD
jgi:hypothetical protein